MPRSYIESTRFYTEAEQTRAMLLLSEKKKKTNKQRWVGYVRYHSYVFSYERMTGWEAEAAVAY